MERKEGVSIFFRGENNGSTQVTSPLGNVEVLLMVEKVEVGSFNMGV
jgi:hypothetical protein